MDVHASLITELEDAIGRGWGGRGDVVVRRIADLFLDAEHYDAEQIALYDDVLERLIVNIETKTLAELSGRLAPVDHAPPRTIGQLAANDEIAVAGPVLTHSNRLEEADLMRIAATKSQDHLLAIAARKQLNQPLTDILVQRGDQHVARSVASNPGASISEPGFETLAARADADEALALSIARRPEVPLRIYCALLARATEVVRQRLLAVTRLEAHTEIRRAVEKVAGEMADRTPVARDYVRALRNVILAHSGGKLGEADVLNFARAHQFEETVAAISISCAIPLEVADQIMSGDALETSLTLCKLAGFEWATVRAILQIRPNKARLSSERLVALCDDYANLSTANAATVLQVWQNRHHPPVPDVAAI